MSSSHSTTGSSARSAWRTKPPSAPAAGIAYHADGKLHIMKKAKPAHVLRFRIPLETSVVMGHTRYATQGDAKKAYNAHPFQGQIGNKKFALAHNGVLLNDRLLQQAEDLPKTHIGTDSYVAVQLLEKQNALNFNSLRNVAEEVQGTFVFTVLDAQDNLYFVHGDNPLCLYHFPKQGIYVYASTQSILEHGLTASGLSFLKKPVEVKTDEGDILRIDRHGKQKLQHFCINSFCPPCYSDAIEKSGTYYLMALIPLAGPIILTIYLCTDSTEDNQYGPRKTDRSLL